MELREVVVQRAFTGGKERMKGRGIRYTSINKKRNSRMINPTGGID